MARPNPPPDPGDSALDQAIRERLGDDADADLDDPIAEAVAITLDAELGEAERTQAIAQVLGELLERAEPGQRARFAELAEEEGPVAALRYLGNAVHGAPR